MTMNDKTKKYMTIELLFCLDDIKLREHLLYKIRKFYENSIIIFFNIHQSYNCWKLYNPLLYVLLTKHLSIILVIDQLNAQILVL